MIIHVCKNKTLCSCKCDVILLKKRITLYNDSHL